MFIRLYPGMENLTIEDIRRKLNSDEKPALLQSIQRVMVWIPRLSPFWRKHRMQLSNMIDQLGSPHLFFTLSAADLHWPDLHRLIEEQRSQLGDGLPLGPLDEHAIHTRHVDNLTKYPHTVASFLQSRVKEFLSTIGKHPEFEHTNHWYRYKWQHRGSGHVHGFLWLKDGPMKIKKSDRTWHNTLLEKSFPTLQFQTIHDRQPIPASDQHPLQTVTT
jgi:ATP-dependent DNA helicase PIF1